MRIIKTSEAMQGIAWKKQTHRHNPGMEMPGATDQNQEAQRYGPLGDARTRRHAPSGQAIKSTGWMPWH